MWGSITDLVEVRSGFLRARTRVLAARCARVLRHCSPSSGTEGAGKAGCALHPRSRVQCAQGNAHTSIQVSGEHPAFPAQWFYGLWRALPGDRLVATIAMRKTPQDLTPASGRQDHTLLPY